MIEVQQGDCGADERRPRRRAGSRRCGAQESDHVDHAAHEGILVGISCGLTAAAAMRTAKTPENSSKIIVIVLIDLGERNPSTVLFEGHIDVRGVAA